MTEVAPTVYEPLTTVFPAPTKCWNDPPGGWAIFGDPVWFKQGGDDKSSCFPPSFYVGDHAATDTSIVYSPGLCPSGWTSACHALRTSDSNSETVTTCCPSLYNCVATKPAFSFEKVFGCVQPLTNVNREAYGINTTANIVSSMYQRQIMIMTQATTTSTSSSTLLTSQAATASQASAPTSTPTTSQSSSPVPANGGMSAGVKAGIAVGAIAGAAVIALLFYVAWRLSSKKRSNGPEVTEQKPAHHSGPYPPGPYQSGQAATWHQPPVEMYGGDRVELDGSVRTPR